MNNKKEDKESLRENFDSSESLSIVRNKNEIIKYCEAQCEFYKSHCANCPNYSSNKYCSFKYMTDRKLLLHYRKFVENLRD